MCSVATLDFNQEATYDFRDMAAFLQRNQNFYNTTEPMEEDKPNDEIKNTQVAGKQSYFDWLRSAFKERAPLSLQ
jgi:hypothetical protein